jgi:signal transduction histidine kinase
MEWFANKGQVLQVIAAIVAAVIVLINVFVAKEKVPSVVVLVIALGWLAFSVIIFFRNRAQTAEIKTASKKTATASMGKIPFDYLPQESPLVHG